VRHRPVASMATPSDWWELPFREIWVEDFEFYPGLGTNNGGRDGDPVTPLCWVGMEMRSGRVLRLGQDQLDRCPVDFADPSVLTIGYMISAELGCHIALGWSQPANCIDPYVEFRHLTNDARIKSGDRNAGFYSLDGALRYFGLDLIDSARKHDMRARIIQGPPYPFPLPGEIVNYCEGDVRALAHLVPHIIRTTRSLPHALMRGQFMWAIAQQERRGIPIDMPWYERITSRWDAIQCDLVREKDAAYGVYVIEDGKPHFKLELFGDLLRREQIPWRRLASGQYDLSSKTFEEQTKNHPRLDGLRELRSTMSMLRKNRLQIGNDGRNRALLGPFGSKTSRNQPSTAKYIFGPAKCLRFLISPARTALVHRDYEQQEAQIAAVLSGDEALLAACATGDVYLGIAKQLGFVPEDADKNSHGKVRDQFKTVVLGILYGLGPPALAAKIGVSVFEAAEILARLKAQFRAFEEFAANVTDRAGLDLEISNGWGWWMLCPPGTSARTIRNYPIQSTGAEIMRAACILAERRGVRIIAPVHDAFMAEGPADQVEVVSAELDRAMRDASRVILRGYELRTDKQVILPRQRFYDKRGAGMWETITRLVSKLEKAA
jgi:DNA polymerase family A